MHFVTWYETNVNEYDPKLIIAQKIIANHVWYTEFQIDETWMFIS